MSGRITIVAGTKKVGDTIGKFRITGFGREWSERVTDDTACAYGMEPGRDYYPRVKMQYAYGVREA
jgi:hypothetical protein